MWDKEFVGREIAATVQAAAGAVNRNRRHNSVATITIGCGLA
jgi:hypothetical protein